MGQHELLDNNSCQVIKEMIKRNEITIEELDTPTLDALFEYESELVCAGESDDELLRQCAELLDPVDQKDDVEQKYRDLIRNALEPRTIHDMPSKRNRTRLRNILIIAATFLVLVIGVSAIAGAMGFGVVDYIKEIIGLPLGGQADKGKVTLIHPNESKEYSSVEELLRNQNLAILYPTKLPDGISIERVYIYDTENGGISIEFFTGSADTSIIVDTVGIREEYVDCENYHFEGRDYYLFEESGYYAIGYDDNNLYTICSTSRENIILIIENLKELGE